MTQYGADPEASFVRMVYDINQFMRNNVLPLMASEQPLDGNVAADNDRLMYVTRLLGSQQGLNTALAGTVVLLANPDEVWHWLNGWWRLFAGLAWLALLVGSLRISYVDWIPKYYERRFGSVQAARAPVSRRNAIFSIALLALLFIGWPIAHYLDPMARLHTAISDPARQINLWPSVFWVLLLCGSLRSHMSGAERQRLYFVLIGIIGFVSIVSYAIWYPEVKQLELWKILNAGGLGLSLIALGLYDHTVLVRALPKRVAERDDE